MKLYYILTSIFLIAFHLIVVSPVSHENKRLKAEYSHTDKKLQVGKKKLSTHEQVTSDWLRHKDDMDQISRILPDGSQSLQSLLADLSTHADQHDVLCSMNHSRPASRTEKGFYVDEYYGITLEGPLDHIQRFVRDLHQSTRIINIHEWSLFSNPDRKNAYRSELIIHTYSFLKHSAPPLKKGRKRKKT